MNTSACRTELDESIAADALKQAEIEGKTLQQWVNDVLEQRFRFERQAAEFFRPRIERASGRRLSEILEGVGNNPPDPGDELED